MKTTLYLILLIFITLNVSAQVVLPSYQGTFYINNEFTCGDEFTDERDNSVYGTVKLGSQCWMSENLAYLPSVNMLSTSSSTIACYYVYGYDGTNIVDAKANPNYAIYGVMYNWTAAMNSAVTSNTNPSGVQGACPLGWHLPSDDEYKDLEMFLGLTQAEANASGFRGINEGSKLASNSYLWDDGLLKSNEAIGTSGFEGLPGGYCSSSSFHFSGSVTTFWTTTEANSSSAYHRRLYASDARVYHFFVQKNTGVSVRCVKNNE